MAWLGFAWYGLASLGFDWLGFACLRLVWLALASLGLASLGFTWLRLVSLGLSWLRLPSLGSIDGNWMVHFRKLDGLLMERMQSINGNIFEPEKAIFDEF